jgi:uncharacterized delta-60 repeat protein
MDFIQAFPKDIMKLAVNSSDRLERDSRRNATVMQSCGHKTYFTSLLIFSGLLMCLAAVAQVAVDSFNPNPDNAVETMAVQPDGKILIGGIFANVGGQARSCIARLNTDGSLDTNFNPGASSSLPEVSCLTLQPNGQILVGGGFTTLAGNSRNYLGRLNADGSLDTTFNPGPNVDVINLIVLTNGQILVGGAFTTIGGASRTGLALLNSDGSVDTNFNAQVNSNATTGINSVLTTVVQPDGKILVGGFFTNLDGAARSHIGRLNADGTLDASFNPGADTNVAVIALQTNGQILVGGDFTNLAGASRNGIGRLNTNGTIDTTFNPGATGGSPYNYVRNLALQTDGKIVVGGNFTTLAGQSQNFLGRLNSDGSLDSSFNISATAGGVMEGDNLGPSVYGLAIQGDGEILVGGSFVALGGQSRNFIGRLTNSTAAVQTLTLSPDGTTITWNRSGSGPEVASVLFQSSFDGVNYNNLGSGTRITGGWQLTGLSIPSTQALFIQANGQSPGGAGNGSITIIQSVLQLYASTAITRLMHTTVLGNGSFQFAFTNANTNFTVLASTNPMLPSSNWTVLGFPSQVSPGYFQYTDTQAPNYPVRFYRVSSP